MAMYSTRTADDILTDMKANVRNDVDKREGSVVHDMLMPPSMEIEMIGYELDAILELGFADTSQGEYLARRAAEQNVILKEAVKAKGQVTFGGSEGTEIQIGTRVYTDSGAFFITKTYGVITGGTATVEAEAEIAGIEGNVGMAQINAIENAPSGITTVTNAANFTGGVDIESDDDLKARYLLKVRKPITSGNIYHYEKWATDVEGVSKAKVYPIWSGPGTVKVVLIGTNGRAPSQSIVNAAVAYIEEQRPIGATVTVIPVIEVPVNITATVTLEGTLTPADVRGAVESSINAYLINAVGTVRISQVANAIIDTDGVLDYANLTVNGGTANVTINSESIAVAGTVTLNGAT